MTHHNKTRGMGYRFARKRSQDGGGKKKSKRRPYYEAHGKKVPEPR